MSDKPLFENIDEQEATYAPQQRPEATDQESPVDVVPLAVPGTGPVVGIGGASGIPGPVGADPATIAPDHADATNDDTDVADRS